MAFLKIFVTKFIALPILNITAINRQFQFYVIDLIDIGK